ncbi:MAG: DnaA regulatory inactivator Hda [Pseudomonadota bacterium]
MLFSPQLPLPLEPRRIGGLDDFVVGPNVAVKGAVAEVSADEDRSLYLYGPAGSGKTHLLNAACLAAREQGRTAFYLGLRGLGPGDSGALEGLEAMNLVCIDDLQRVAGQPAWEEALFHFINRLRGQRGCLLVASRERLRRLPLALPDLASRLAWGLRLELQTLGDEDKRDVLEAHARSLGIELPAAVSDYLLRRGPRDMATLVGLVTRLQQAAFRDKRQVTVHLARQLMQA